MRLENELESLAATTPLPAARDDLWVRGTRWGRRRRAGTAAIVVVAVLAVAGLLAPSLLVERSALEPAADVPRSLALPDTFYDPSPWLPSTDEPTGVLNAVMLAPRGRWTDEPLSRRRTGVVGISATGAYRFLDLPGAADQVGGSILGDDGPALSPDGRLVAYWYVGSTRQEPNTRDGNGPAYAGVAVWNAMTGDVRRLPLPSDHGIQGDTLVWGGGRVWLSPFANDSATSTSATSDGSVAWSPRTGAVTRFDRALVITDSTEVGSLRDSSLIADGGLLTLAGRRLLARGVSTVQGDRTPASVRWTTSRLGTGAAYASPDSRRVAMLADRDGKASTDDGVPTALLVGRLDRGRELRGDSALLTLSRVGDARFAAVVGWRDDDHVVVQQGRGRQVVWSSVDVATGDATELATTDAGSTVLPQVAQDAWQAPLLDDAPAPPSRIDPRLGIALGLLAAVAGAAGLLVWRRRAQP